MTTLGGPPEPDPDSLNLKKSLKGAAQVVPGSDIDTGTGRVIISLSLSDQDIAVGPVTGEMKEVGVFPVHPVARG